MTFDYSDEPGWPAESTRVVRERLDAAELAHRRNRKVELYPSRYDDRPLHVRALEMRWTDRGAA